MPTPTNKTPIQHVIFNKEHLRYALTILRVMKQRAQEHALEVVPSAEEAPVAWVVRVFRSPLNKPNSKKKKVVLKNLNIRPRVGTVSIQKNCPRVNYQLKQIASLIELKPLRIREDAELPDDKGMTLLTSKAEFYTHPLKKCERLLELEKQYAEKREKEGVKWTPVLRKGDGRSHIETEL